MIHQRRIRWKMIPNTKGFYQISEYGQVRTIKKHLRTFSIQNLHSQEYSAVKFEFAEKKYGNHFLKVPYINVEEQNFKIAKPVSSLVYSSFHGIDNLHHTELFHYDGNELNNSIDNLILCEKIRKIDIINSHYNPEIGMLNFVEDKHTIATGLTAYSINGIQIKQFRSKGEASKVLDMPVNIINRLIEARTMLKQENTIVKRGLGPAAIDTNLIDRNYIVANDSLNAINLRIVFQYDKKGALIEVYNNVNEAAIKCKIPVTELQKAIQDNSVLDNSFWICHK